MQIGKPIRIAALKKDVSVTVNQENFVVKNISSLVVLTKIKLMNYFYVNILIFYHEFFLIYGKHGLQ